VNKGDERTALAVLRDLAEMQGLYPPQKRELTGKGGGPLRFSLEEAVQADQELENWQREHQHQQSGAGGDVPAGNPQMP
jgi:hypothetical protein